MQAAYVTTRGPGFRMAMTETSDIGGQPIAVTADGAFEQGGGQGVMTEKVNGVTGTVILKRPYIYFQTAGRTIQGKPWGKANIEGLTQALGLGSSLSTSDDPSQWVEYLKAAGQVTTLGSEAVRGQSTTHYHVLVDFSRYPSVVPASIHAQAQQQVSLLKRMSGQSTLPVDVWIDPQKRIRRYQTQMPLCIAGARASESVNVELYDYGRQPAVQTPSESEVSDLTSELDSHASRALQQLHC
jgi:hypothetical protein